MRRILTCALLMLAFALPAAGQVVTSTTGAINGSVTDNTKAVLPGVTVTIQSPQMMGSREGVTDEQGRFQFAAIPPGEYKVTFALPGFATLVRENVRVTLGFTASVNGELQVATQQETITVTGESPVVDTQAATITNNFDAADIANLPTARDIYALMAETPGVSMTRIDVGGSGAMSETGFTVYGMSNGGSQTAIEGIKGGMNYNDFGSFSEVQITTAGHTAEMAVPGVMRNLIAKSGGNSYHGAFYIDYEKDEWGARNIDDAKLALGVTGGFDLDARDTNRVDLYKDINGDVGGFVVKDKIWWYGSLRYNASDVRFVNFPVKPQYTRVDSRGGKVTYNLTANNKFIGYYNRNFKYQPERFVSKNDIHYSLDEPWDEDFPVGNWKVEYNSVLTQSAFFEVRYGDFFYDFWNYNRAPNKPLRYDTSTQERFGGTASNYRHIRRPQLNGSLSYFVNGWGTHNLKLGGEMARNWHTFSEPGRGGRDGETGNLPPDVQHNLVNGVPSEVILRETPSLSKNFLWNNSLYLNDAWQFNDYLSFNLGLRYDYYRAGSPEQVHPAGFFNPTEDRFDAIDNAYSFGEVGPRVGIIWNVRGNGKTVVKANWGLYGWETNDRGEPGQNPNPPTWSRRYTWNDLNGDRLWQPGEETRLVEELGGITNNRIDPNWKKNRTQDLSTWVERELFPNFGVRSGLIWRGDNQEAVTLNPNRPFSAYNIPITVPDPGPDGRAGTADDGPSFTGYNLDPAALAAPLINMRTHNPYIHGSDHYTWEIAGTKRMSNHWSMNASFAHTWSRQAVNGTNPNAFTMTEDGTRRNYTNYQAKLASTIMLPRDIKISPLWRFQSGDPYGRTITFRMNYGNQTYQVEPESARRVDNVSLWDVRLEKGMSLLGRRAALFLDVFNILNANPDQEIVQSSGAAFRRPVVIVGPRVARVGGKFDW